MENIKKVLAQFNLADEIAEIKPMTSGHINNTCRVKLASGAQYTLQAINTFVFKEPEKVMDNILAVTDHIRGKLEAAGGDTERGCLRVVLTKDGKPMYRDEEDTCWRVYGFVDHARTYDVIEDPIQLYNAGRGFGMFQRMLSDFPMDSLYETIPDFHNTPKRFEALFEAARQDKAGRAESVSEDIAFYKERLEAASLLVKLTEEGEIPLRVTHNDTKVNNILIDDATNEALCVIDLDTVMPGWVALDFGDALRFAANTAEEDETDLSKVSFDMNLYEQFTRGFLREAGKYLTEKELEYLPHGVRIITLELGARFLTDYLDGDVYFKIHREHHNLERARCQMKLALSIEEKFDEMRAITRTCIEQFK
ncbi:MAG: aminoglycoside phosphotransferase family protein [Ruminococcaceae bacterium]|nr:aminoglycoside phosphotransferase family protein [Oscillospiraceae bacterium]